jgi:hypothetical protein
MKFTLTLTVILSLFVISSYSFTDNNSTDVEVSKRKNIDLTLIPQKNNSGSKNLTNTTNSTKNTTNSTKNATNTTTNNTTNTTVATPFTPVFFDGVYHDIYGEVILT